MFTFTRRQCRVTAFALLVLFVSALGLLGACAVWCGPLHGAGVKGAVISGAQASQQSCCARKAAEAQRKQSKKTACCTHEKAAKWADVPDGPLLVKLLKNALPALGLPPGTPEWQPTPWARAWACTLAVRLVPPRHLPPKIPDLRVFLHSLIV